MLRRGDSTTNVVLFLVVLVAAMVLTTWYISAVRPNRVAIASALDDSRELRQHIANACGSSIYRASYLTTSSRGRLLLNATHVCITTEVFGSCDPAPCALAQADITLDGRTLLSINATGGPVAVSPGS